MADPAITSLLVHDGNGAGQNLATVSQGGNLFPAHAAYGWDGANAHPILVDSAGRPLLGPSGQIIGKVGIDQTTPGTTNGVVVNQAPYMRLLQTQQSFTPSASYTTGQPFGSPAGAGSSAVFTWDLSGTIGASAQQVRLSNLMMVLLAAAFTTSGMTTYWFNANPTGSTFTDAGTSSLVAADKAKLQYSTGLAANTASQMGSGVATFLTGNIVGGVPMMTDSGGKLYMVIIAGGVETITTPAASELTANFLY